MLSFYFNSFPNNKISTFPNLKTLQMRISNLTEMAESSPNGLKTLWEKAKLPIRSNFSFSLSVFKRFVLQTRKNQGLFGKGLSFGCTDRQTPVKLYTQTFR